MTLRNCDVCSVEYEAKTARSKFCSARCRMRNHERPRPESRSPQIAAVAEDAATDVLGHTKEELAAAGRLDTALGHAALVAAIRLDHFRGEPGTSVAALLRAHREALAEALKGAHTVADPVDELRERRDRRRAG